MRIYIADLCYLHDWDNNQPLPLNVAYITAYLKQKNPDVSIEIFKDPRFLIDRISDDPPDVLALSHYDWNVNLDLTVLRHAKKIRPQMLTIMGGPNFEADDPKWIKTFFSQRPELDLYITGEGEWSFARLIELLDNHGGELDRVPVEDWPSSYFSFERASQQVICNPGNPVARLDLSTVPSPYLTGLMDPFLQDMRLAPIVETNRGCPYACTFCCWGHATKSKIIQFPLETVFDEIRYAAGNTKNFSGYFYVADSNFGIVKRDLEIARVLQECSDTHGVPKRMYIYFAKNTNDSVIKIAETLKTVTHMSMSKQTINPEVLDDIKRKNISSENYDRLRTECQKRNIDTSCELIYGLAGETCESFIEGVIQTVRGRQYVVMYPHIMIAGAESNSAASRRQFGFKSAFRVIPRYVSSYKDIHSLEYEEIITETNTFSHEDFLRLRLFQFLIYVLGSELFTEFTRCLDICGLDYATLADRITRDGDNWAPQWRALLAAFRQSCENELIPADQVKLEFSAEDIKTVDAHQLALVPFYMAKLVSTAEIIADLKTYLKESLGRFFGEELSNDEMSELEITLGMGLDKIVCYENPLPSKVVEYEYDLESWLSDESYAPLRDYHLGRAVPFHFQLDDDILPSVEKARSYTSSMAEAVYRVRINVIGPTGDRIYCYRRNLDPNMPGDMREQIDKVNEKRILARQCAEIASRTS